MSDVEAILRVRVDPATRDLLKERAETNHRSIGGEVRFLIDVALHGAADRTSAPSVQTLRRSAPAPQVSDKTSEAA